MPDLIKAARAEQGSRGVLAAMTSHRDWGDFGIADEEMLRAARGSSTRVDGAGAVRAFFGPTPSKQGKPRWGDKTPAYVRQDAADQADAAGGALHPPDPRRARRRPLAVRPGAERAAAAGRAGRALACKRIGKAREQAAALKGAALHRGPLRGPRPRPGDEAAADLRVHRPALGRAVLDYHERAAERLTEMAGTLRAEGTHAEQAAGYGSRTTRRRRSRPDPAKLDKWRREMAPDGPRRLRRGRRRPAPRARLRGDESGGASLGASGIGIGHQVVQPRPGVRLALHPRRARRPRPRDLHPRPPDPDKGPMAAHVDRDRRLGSARRDRGLRLGGAVRGVRALDRRQRDRGRPLGQLLPARGDRAAPRVGVKTVGRFVWEMFGADDAEPAKARLRRPLLADPLRAASATPSSGSRAPTSSGASTRSCSRLAEPTTADAKRTDPSSSIYFPGALLGPRKPHKEVIEAFTRRQGRQPAADLQGAARAPHELPRRRRPRPTRGSSSSSTTCRPTSTCGCSPPATSASARAAGRASGCSSTRRSRSGCRGSPTTARR